MHKHIPRGWLLVMAGGLYLLSVRYHIFSLHCPFRLVTGFLCPGCGVTTMMVRLSYGDITGAFAANPVVMMLSPLILLLIYHSYHPERWHVLPYHLLERGCIIILIVWGIGRNIVR